MTGFNYLVQCEPSNFGYTSTEGKINNFLTKAIYFKDLSSTITIQKCEWVKQLQ
jgi:hypothetical protein